MVCAVCVRTYGDHEQTAIIIDAFTRVFSECYRDSVGTILPTIPVLGLVGSKAPIDMS